MKLNSIVLNGLLALAFAAAPAVSMAASKPAVAERDNVLELLKDFHAKAAEASAHADELQVIARDPNSDWEIHTAKLDYLKDDINEMGRSLVALDNMRDSATPWEKKAIDEALPILKKMASNTQSALIYVNGNRNRLYVPTYTQYVNDLAVSAERLSDSVGHVIQYAKVHSKEDRLEKTLGVSGGTF